MCYLRYTNSQWQGAVANMMVAEVLAAEQCQDYRVIQVQQHRSVTTHGLAKIACHVRVYQLLMDYVEPKKGTDYVFTSSNGEKVTHVTVELEQLGKYFGKIFTLSPTPNRKQTEMTLKQESDVRATASYMSETSAQKSKSPDRYYGKAISFKAVGRNLETMPLHWSIFGHLNACLCYPLWLGKVPLMAVLVSLMVNY